MKINKYLIIFFLIIIFALLGYFFLRNNGKENPFTKKSDKKISIVTTLFPLYDFARVIGGEYVEVSLLLPPGVEAHSFEPKPADIVKINTADVFVYTGKFMEPWAHDIIESTDKKVKIVDTSVGIELIKGNKHNHEEDHHEEEHHHEGVDPHFWLDFENAKIMVDNITKALIQKDSSNMFYYEENSKKYKEKLTILDNEYKMSLMNCKSREIVYGGHYAFGYMAKRYNLNYSAAQGFSPDSEPTANDLISLVEQIKGNNIKYIFYEELSNPKITETLSKETGAQMLLLNGAHNLSKEDFENNITYLSLMENNLKNLSVGLFCEK